MQHASRTNPITFAASYDPEAGEVTIIQNRYAGVSGPAGTYIATGASLEKVLFAAGYVLSSTWTNDTYGDTMSADLTPMFNA